MTISWHDNHFLLKTKTVPVVLGAPLRVGEMTLPSYGEYDLNDVFVESLPLKETPQGAVVVRCEGMTLLWVPQLKEALSQSSEEILDGIDVVLGVIGGEQLTSDQAESIIKSLDPKAVVLRDEGEGATLLKKEGVSAEESSAFKLTPSALPEEGRRLIRLT